MNRGCLNCGEKLITSSATETLCAKCKNQKIDNIKALSKK